MTHLSQLGKLRIAGLTAKVIPVGNNCSMGALKEPHLSPMYGYSWLGFACLRLSFYQSTLTTRAMESIPGLRMREGSAMPETLHYYSIGFSGRGRHSDYDIHHLSQCRVHDC